MTTESLLVFGGGGHALAVADVLARLGRRVAAQACPSRPAESAHRYVGDDAAGISLALAEGLACVVAVGDNALRLRLTERLAASGLPPTVIVAATATVAADAVLGPGTIVMEHAHVGPGSFTGAAVVVNTAAVVEHDCRLGDAVHCAPGSVLTGGVTCGDGVLVGAGAVVAPGRWIGSGARIGAGAAVVADVSPAATVAGVPARQRG